MGLLDNLMPGESYGIPAGYGQPQGGGLLSNPLLQIGLGILANNNSKNLGQVLGRGALAGMNNLQQQQQYDQQRKMQEYQFKKAERKQQEYDRQQKALEAFKVKNPQYADIVELDPKLAIKAANPNLASNSADPYTSIVYDQQGNGYLQNHRETDPNKALVPINVGGKPFTGAKYSPELAESIKRSEASGTAAYKVDNSIPGVVSTAKQVAEQANPSLLQPQIPAGTPMLPQGAPQTATPQSMRIAPNVQRQRDDKRLQILLSERDPNMPNPELEKEIANVQRGLGGQPAPVSGIRVPTPAEQAALTTRATEQAKVDIGLGADKSKNVKKADQFLSVAQQAKSILEDSENKPTASGTGALVDSVAGNVFGYATEGSIPAARLDALSGWLVSNVPRMEGPQSNFDVQNYQTMAGLIGDRTKPLKVRQNALDEVIKLQQKYKALNQDGAQSTSGGETPSPTKVRKYNPKTGRIE